MFVRSAHTRFDAVVFTSAEKFKLAFVRLVVGKFRIDWSFSCTLEFGPLKLKTLELDDSLVCVRFEYGAVVEVNESRLF